MRVEIQNPVFCRVFTAEDAKIIASFLKFKASYWRQTQFRKVQKEWEKPLIKKGVFLTGFLPRVREYCSARNIPFVLQGNTTSIIPSVRREIVEIEQIKIPGGLKLKPDQVEAISNAINQLRGVIHHPTGSGKTIIFLSFISLFPDSKALIIVNTQDLLSQTAENAEGFFPGDVGIVGGGSFDPKRITVATIQTLSKFTTDDFDFNYDIVVVDEAHHVSKFSQPFSNDKGGTYARVLSMVPAPIRLGFTATLPYTEEAKLALEGYIGQVISAKKIQEVGRLAKIKVILKKLPITLAARESKTYPDVYKYAVTYNSRRHKMVLQVTSELVEEGRTALILVTQVQHGENVLSMAERSFPHLRIDYVHGQISGTNREQIKKKLNSGELNVVIADAVWREGVDIPTLGAIINASGGKSEIMTLQSLGRGLRTVPGIKEDVVLVDFFDPSHRYLVDHFGMRLCLYFDEGWI